MMMKEKKNIYISALVHIKIHQCIKNMFTTATHKETFFFFFSSSVAQTGHHITGKKKKKHSPNPGSMLQLDSRYQGNEYSTGEAVT